MYRKIVMYDRPVFSASSRDDTSSSISVFIIRARALALTFAYLI
jgi:hypothetical protein